MVAAVHSVFVLAAHKGSHALPMAPQCDVLGADVAPAAPQLVGDRAASAGGGRWRRGCGGRRSALMGRCGGAHSACGSSSVAAAAPCAPMGVQTPLL